LLTLEEIKTEVDKLANILGVPASNLPTYGYSQQTGHPHVEIDSQGYYYAVFERGHIVKHHHTTDIDELLYYIFADVTFELSIKYELTHRIKNQDSRRIWFEYQVRLLTMLSPQWGLRETREHESILAQHPFHDTTNEP